MIEKLENIPSSFQSPSPVEEVKIENFEGFGDLTVGVGSNWQILFTALCMQNHPQTNKFLLAQKLRLTDKMTKTKIFPREGMALPNGEIYKEPTTEKKEG